MKTIISGANAESIEKGFKNPYGMLISNEPETRQAVAIYAKSLIENLHKEKKQNSFYQNKGL